MAARGSLCHFPGYICGHSPALVPPHLLFPDRVGCWVGIRGHPCQPISSACGWKRVLALGPQAVARGHSKHHWFRNITSVGGASEPGVTPAPARVGVQAYCLATGACRFIEIKFIRTL